MHKAKALYGADYVYDPEHDISAREKASLVIAYAFLKTLGLAGDIGTITADFAASRAEATPGHKVVSFEDYTLTVESRRYPFWFPALSRGRRPGRSDPPLRAVRRRAESLHARRQEPADRASENYLARRESRLFDRRARPGNQPGRPLSRHPFRRPMQNVDNAVRDQQQQERISGSFFVQNNAKDTAGLAQRELFRRRADERFVPVTHTLRIQPLASPPKQPQGPIPVIVDTDISSDCDDAGAVALLNTFMNQGEANAAGLRRQRSRSRPVVRRHDSGDQRLVWPSGHSDRRLPRHGRLYHRQRVHEKGPSTFRPRFSQRRPPARRRRRLSPGSRAGRRRHGGHRQPGLSAKPGRTVEIAARRGRAICPGLELVRKKVRQIVIMNNQQKEDDFVVAHWPTEIIWTMDVGSHIYTGKSLAATPAENPVRFIYGLHGDDKHNSLRDGRQSWDLTASWLAVRGPGELWDIASGGGWQVNTQAGGGQWVNGPATNQGLVMVKMPPPEVTRLIEAELSRRGSDAQSVESLDYVLNREFPRT